MAARPIELIVWDHSYYFANTLTEHTFGVELFEAMDMPFTILLDSDGAAARRYGLRGLPTSLLVDRDGVIRLVHVGIATDAMLREHVLGLLGRNG